MPSGSVDAEALAVTVSGADVGVTVSAAVGCPTSAGAVAVEVWPALSVTVTETV